jgi:membrane protein DedA with SNARE-associated domain
LKTRGYNKKSNKKGWDEIPEFFTMFLDYYLEYKYPVLALIMIISFNGIPLGANFYVAISGVLASTNDRPFFPLFLFVWAIAILGDLSIGYFFAESWEEIIALISSLGQGGAIILLLIVLFLYIKRKRKK